MIGKVNDDLFKRAILPHTGAPSHEVLVGPRMGVDAAIIRVGDDYMAIAEDPIFPGPTTSPEDFGWITVHIGASDVAVMGIRPRFMTYSLLFPPETSEDYVEALVRSISDTAKELGISIVGGHTGFYSAVTVPTVGGITVWGFGKEYVTPAGAQIGDRVILTKGVAIEAAGILASEFGDRLLAAGLPAHLVERARRRFREITVVKDAIVASGVGGVHAMHDATEGGLERCLWEIAEASGVGLRIERNRVPVPEDVRAVCEHFSLAPFQVISEGTLVLTCSPSRTGDLLRAFEDVGIPAAEIGEVVPLGEGRCWIECDGRKQVINPPLIDRFWEAFFSALSGSGDEQKSD